MKLIHFCTFVFLIFSCSLKGQEQEVAREKLLTLLSGEWVSRGIYVATKLEIADHLEQEPKSVEELSNLTKSDPDSLYRLLRMLSGFQVFEELEPRIFTNTHASRLLIKTNESSLHKLSLFYGEDIHQAWEEFFISIQTGLPAFDLAFKQPVFSYFKENPEKASLFQEAMKEKSKAVIESSLLTYDFSQFQSIYDIGGGYGQFMQTLLKTYPSLSGTLFELPEVIAKIKEQNPQFESDRLTLYPGDFFISIPKGGDSYFLKSVLHDWNDEKAKHILKNCYEAMGTESKLLIVEVVLLPDNQSIYANCMDVLMLAITGGKERTLSSFQEMLESTGFFLKKVYPTSTEFSILEVVKKS